MSLMFQHIENFNLEIATQVFEFLKNLEMEYPHFTEWYNQKVCGGLKNKTRSILIVSDKEQQKIAGISILKHSGEKKICTFRVVSEFQNQGIGTKLMEKTIEILGTTSPLITVSEEHIEEFKPLLKKFNFQESHKYLDYYRKGKYEISYNGYLDRCIFSIKPEFAFKILSGEKIFEYRKTRTRKNISLMIIYAGSPIKKVIGEVQVVDIISGTPEEVWSLTNEFSGIGYNAYQEYFAGKKCAYAYRLKSPNSYEPYKNLPDFNITKPPQSYQYL